MSHPLPGYLKLLLASTCIWVLLWVLTPLWVAQSPLHQDFAAAQEYYDVPIGALYYNDIPFIIDASMETRDTWRFLPRGPIAHKQ
ncbi:MAG: hypothetical protein RRY20_01255 [Bilophila sp.]